MAHIEIESANQRKFRSSYDDVTVSSDDEIVSDTVYKKYDQDREMKIINDNALKAKRMLPRDWSKDLFSSPLMTFDGHYHINKKYAQLLQKQLQEIKELVKPNLNTG